MIKFCLRYVLFTCGLLIPIASPAVGASDFPSDTALDSVQLSRLLAETDTHEVHRGDLDGNGNSDFIFLRDGELSVYLTDEDGSFTRADLPETFLSGGVPTAAVVADLNRDTYDDLVVSTPGFLHALLGGPALQLATVTTPAATPPSIVRSLAFLDLDGDHKLEIVAAVEGYNFVTRWRRGKFRRSTAAFNGFGPQRSLALAFEDLNGDTLPDLIVGNIGYVETYLARPDRTFEATRERFNERGQAHNAPIAAQDLNGDGVRDLVFGSHSVYLHTAAGSYSLVDPFRASSPVYYDVALQKASLPSTPVDPGDQIQYQIVVTNEGLRTLNTQLVIVDTLPPGITYVSSTSINGPWSCSSNNASPESITCVRPEGSGSLLPGQQSAITVTATVDAGASGILTNLASVSIVNPFVVDGDASNNDDKAPVTVKPPPTSWDVAVTKTAGTDKTTAGGLILYTLAVSNHSPQDLTSPLSVRDVLPIGLTLEATSSSDGLWGCSGDHAVPQSISCARPAAVLASGTASLITITARVSEDVLGAVQNAASVSITDPLITDADPTNNSDDATVLVEAPDDECKTGVCSDADHDLALSKDATVPETEPGTQVVFDFTVTNLGREDINEALSISDPLPAGLSFVGASSADQSWNCQGDGATPEVVTCLRKAGLLLAKGAGKTSFSLTVEAAPDLEGEVINQALLSIDGATVDSVAANNGDSASVLLRLLAIYPVPALGPLGFGLLSLMLLIAGLRTLRGDRATDAA